MFAFGVPVPGTMSAVVAASARVDMSAAPTPRTAVPRRDSRVRTRTRADLRMCQRSHSGGAGVGGTKNFLAQTSPKPSDSHGAVRRTGREWVTRDLLTAER